MPSIGNLFKFGYSDTATGTVTYLTEVTSVPHLSFTVGMEPLETLGGDTEQFDTTGIKTYKPFTVTKNYVAAEYETLRGLAEAGTAKWWVYETPAGAKYRINGKISDFDGDAVVKKQWVKHSFTVTPTGLEDSGNAVVYTAGT